MFVHLCIHSICLFFYWHMPFQEEQELLRPSTLHEDFLEPLSLVSFLIFVLSESSKEEKTSSPEKKKVHRHIYICTYIYMHTGTYIYVHIHTHIYISGALAQLTLKNYTSNRLREDNKLNVCLLPQWMHRASVLRPQWSEEDWEHEECDHLFY